MQATLSRNTIAQLETCYQLRHRDAILAHLSEKPFLVPLLTETYPHIQQFFDACPCYLELDSDSGTLYLLIGTSCSGQETLRLSQEFDRAWWQSQYRHAAGHLIIDVEYQPLSV